MRESELIFFFLIIAIGYFSAHFRVFSEDTVAIIPQLLMNIFYPALIFASFLQIDIGSLTGSGLPVFSATIVFTLSLYWVSGILLRKKPPEQQMLIRFQAAIGNVTYAAIPLFSVFFGPSATIIAIVHSTAQDLLIWSVYYPRSLTVQSFNSCKCEAFFTNRASLH